MPQSVVLKLEYLTESLEGLKNRLLGPTSIVSVSVGLG